MGARGGSHHPERLLLRKGMGWADWMRWPRSDTALAFVIIAFALVVAFGLTPFISEEWKATAEARYYVVGPKMFPQLAAGILVLLSLVLIVADRRSATPSRAAGLNAEERRNLAITLVIAVGYLVLLPYLGFLAATVMGLLAFFLCFGERRWYVVVPIVLIGPIVIHYCFATLIQVPLPEGIVEGLLLF